MRVSPREAFITTSKARSPQLAQWLDRGAIAAAGLGAGWIARRTRSLALPAAVHVGLDLPLYVWNACRIA